MHSVGEIARRGAAIFYLTKMACNTVGDFRALEQVNAASAVP